MHEKIDQYQCEICAFETKLKGNLKSHMLIHKKMDEIELFKCRICSFQTKRKSGVNRHMLIHKRTSEN